MACFPNPRLNRLAGLGPKREPNPNTCNLILGFYHWSYLCWRKNLNGFRFRFTEFQRVGMSWRRENMVYWCMLLFLSCLLSSFLFFYYLVFYCSLVLSFFFTLLSVLPLSPVHDFLPSLLHYLILWDFSILSLRLHQPFLVFCGHPSKIAH